MSSTRKIIQIDNSVVNTATPFGGMEYLRNKIYFGENTVKIYVITSYPPSLPSGWSAKLSNLPNTIFSQVIELCDNGELIRYIGRNLTFLNGVAESTRDHVERIRAERKADDAQNLIKQIDRNQEIIVYMSNFIMVSGRDEEQLEKICRKLESAVSSLGCKIRLLTNQQKDAFSTISPYNVPKDELLKLARRNVPMSTVQGGFPFTSHGFIDQDGYILGVDSQNGLIALNFRERGDDRTNSNIVVTGISGQGKSTLVKLIMIKEHMLGIKGIVIDPERENSDLARNLGGDIIYAGGGKSGKFIINPLQVKPVPSDEDGESGNSVSPLAQHIKSVEIFFSLYAPQITSVQLLILKQILEDLYNDFDIHWDTDVSKLKNTEYPIFTDLYNLLTKIIESNKNSMETTYLSDLMFLQLVVRELAHGSDQFLWNGFTTVESNAKFVVIDTYDLKGTSDNIKKAQYYVILTWAWDKMSRDREEKVMLYCDEAYLMVDTRIPQSLIFLDNMSRQARKYWSGLCVITHAVGDFLDPSIRKYGQAILDNATYKFLFGSDGKGLQDISEIFNLTLAEQERLSAKKQRHCIGFIGKRRFYFQVKSSEGNLRRMGRGGGA